MAQGSRPSKLWGGRFGAATAEVVEELNNSFAYDVRLWRDDIEGSIAHAEMLGETGILEASEAERVVNGLRDIARGVEAGVLAFDTRAEDVHTAVEMLLKERIGDLAGKLHTARSRNDQVATDLRLYLKRTASAIEQGLTALQRTLVDAAERELGVILPGYTHMQHAQPVLLSHHLMAYFWMFQRDRQRLRDWLARTDELPLGAGALAGTGFPIRPLSVAQKLGFARVTDNSMDAVSDRDFAIEFLAFAAIMMVHCSRLGEELVLWSCPEFGFVVLDDAVTTGSSMMPQKKNPDVAELARGKTGRVIGHLVALLTTVKALPLTYNKDLQEDKEGVFDTVDTLNAVLPALELTVRTAVFDGERMGRAAAGDFSTATDVADALVRAGVPFRKAHEVVGGLVRLCLDEGLTLEDLTAAKIASLAPELACVADLDMSPAASVASRAAGSGTARRSVEEQLRKAKLALGA